MMVEEEVVEEMVVVVEVMVVVEMMVVVEEMVEVVVGMGEEEGKVVVEEEEVL